jgi:hypothetical protein
LEQFDPLNEKVPKTGLTKDNHGDFKDQFDQAKEGQLFGILGYLYYAKAESQESSNCELPDTADHSNVDFHIGAGFDSSLAQKIPGMSKLSAAARSSLNHQLKSNSVVVEMTPHFRDAFEKNIWTLDSVQKVLGKQVRVVGQLLADNDHNVGSQNCFLATKASEQKSCWRYSIWELHPVVSFQVCRQGTCTQNSGDWVELDQM